MKSLQSLSYKTLFIIFFFSVAGIIFFLKIGGKTTKVSAAWWNESWSYRRSVSVTNASNTNLSDFQVSISIGTSAIIAQGRMKSDCSDIRITDASGNLLPHWIEENNPGCNSASGNTKIWVKLNSLSASGSTVYIYYGNASAASVENGNNVFDFFDDFSTNLNKWSNPTGYDCQASIISGYLNIPANTQCDTYPFKALNLNLSDNPGYILDLRGKYTSGGSNRFEIYQRHRKSNDYWARFWTYDPSITYYQEYTTSGSSNTNAGANNMSAGTWYNIGVQVNGNNNSYFINGTLIGSVTSSSSLSSFSDFTIGLGEYQTAVQYDNVRIRKYASSQPTTTLNSEEVSSGPIAYWKFDEGVGTTAYDSVGSNNGVFGAGSSAPTWVNESQCVSGKCLSFNGSTSIIDTGSTFASLTSAFTISTWVNPGSTQMAYADIFGNHIDGYKGFVCQQNNTTTNQYVCSYGNGSAWVTTGTFNLATNTWQYLSLVKNPTGVIVYVNGVAVANVSSATSVSPSTSNLKIGQGYGSYVDRFFNGKIDEFKIYPYARTAAQIKNDYNSRGSVNSSSVNLGSNTQNIGGTTTSTKYCIPGDTSYCATPIAEYNFEENTGTVAKDTSGNNNNGTLGNTPTWTSGKIGSAVQFNGSNQYANVGNNINASNITIESWVYRTSSSANQGIVRKDSIYALSLYNNTIQVAPGNNWTFYDTGKNLPLNTWTHITWTYDGSLMKVYINGQFVWSNSLTGTLPSNSNPTYIGYDTNGWWFGGKIDDVKVYNYARTSAQVAYDYNQHQPIAYWKLNEGVGTTAYDSAGSNNGIFGTGSSAPTWVTESQCVSGKCLSFDGVNDYVDISSSVPKVSTNFTVSVWFKQNGVISDLYYGALISKNDAGSGYHDNYNLWVDKTTTKLVGRIGFGSTEKLVSSTVSTNDGKWHYGALSANYNGANTTMILYLDGKIVDQATQSGAPYTDGTYANIGKWSTTAQFFPGYIDEVKIYNATLTADEVKQDYNAGSAIKFGSTTQTIGTTTTSLNYCIPGDTTYCATPVAEYNFEENTGTVANDTSGNGYNATFGTGSSAPTWSVGQNNKGAGLNFDGTIQNLTIPSTVTSGLQRFTIGFWVKTTESDTNSTDWLRPSLFGQSTFGTGSGDFGITTNNGYIGFWSGLSSSDTSYLSTTTKINDNKWHYISLSNNGSSASLYVDSIYQSSLNTSYALNTQAFWLGGRNGYSAGSFHSGVFDNLKIYNYARTPAQIAYDYNKGAPIAQWKLDECQGSTVYDSIGTGNTGVIVIGSSGTQNSLGTCQTGTSAAWTNGASGKINSSINFDGTDDYVNLGNSSIFNLTSQFSISTWVKPNNISKTYQLIIGKPSSGTYPTHNFWIEIANSNFKAGIGNNSTSNSVTWSNAISNNNWYNVVFTANGSKLFLYVNGVGVSASQTITPASNSGNINLAEWTGYTSYPFPGQIDDVRIYNYALTNEQVKQIYNGGAVNFQ